MQRTTEIELAKELLGLSAQKSAFLDEAVTSSPAAFPPPELVKDMYPLSVIPPKVERVRTRTWTNFKSGG